MLRAMMLGVTQLVNVGYVKTLSSDPLYSKPLLCLIGGASRCTTLGKVDQTGHYDVLLLVGSSDLCLRGRIMRT